MNVGNDQQTAFEMVETFQVTAPCLLNTDDIYSTYPTTSESYAPYPVHVVLDRTGTVVYFANQYDAEALRAAIESALAGD